MNRFALQLVTSITALSTATATAAQDAPSPPPNPAQPVWTLDWEQSHCTISIGDPKHAQFGVWLSPGGERYEGEVAVLSDDHPAALRLSDLGETFPAAFAKSSEVRLSDGRYALSLPV